ncbi:MAG: PQQ-binding-like beta-propeller repeat protein, partial [Bacteroidales bacterium]
MKLISTLLLSLLMSFCVFAQSSTNSSSFLNNSPNWKPISYSKIASADHSPDVTFEDMKQDAEGNYIYSCTNGKQPYGAKCQIIKLDKQGKEIWNTTIDQYEYTKGQKLFIDKDGNTFVLGKVIRDGLNYEIFITKLSKDGNKEWEKYIRKDNYSTIDPKDVFVDGDDKIWLINNIGIGNSKHAINITQLDNSGDINWQLDIKSEENSDTYISSFFNESNKLEVFCSAVNYKTYKQRPAHYILSREGKLISKNVSDQNIYEQRVIIKDNFIYKLGNESGNTFVQKTKIDGTEIWKENFKANPQDYYLGQLIISSKGNIFALISGAGFGFGRTNKVVKLNPEDGSLIFEANYDNKTSVISEYRNILVDNDENFFFCGWATVKGEKRNFFNTSIVCFDNTGKQLSEDFYLCDADHFNEFTNYFFYKNNQILFFSNPYVNVMDEGRDLFFCAIDSKKNFVFKHSVKRINNSELELNESVLDNEDNVYHGIKSLFSFKIFKQDKDGKTLWEKAYLKDSKAGCTHLKIVKNNYLIAGGIIEDKIIQPIIMRLDKNGEKIWETKIDHSNKIFKDIRPVSIIIDDKENIFVASDIIIEEFVLTNITKLDKTGNIIWSYTSEDFIKQGAVGMDFTLNNDIVVSSFKTNDNIPLTPYSFILNSKDGKVAWEYFKNSDPEQFFIAATCDKDENVYLIESDQKSGTVQKVDKQGKLVWEKTIKDGFFTSILLKNDKIYCGGNFLLDNIGNATLNCYSLDGDLEWQEKLNIGENHTYAFKICSDENYIYQSQSAYNFYKETQVYGLSTYTYDGKLVKLSTEDICVGTKTKLELASIFQNEFRVGLSAKVNIESNYGNYSVSSIYSKPIFDNINELNIEGWLTK